MKKNGLALFLGILFGIGLGIAKMTDPQVVLDFFDIFGKFNPMLLFVFVTALSTTIIGYNLVFKRKTPSLDKEFHLPKLTIVDAKLILGAILFGIGWGISGYCPAPALAILLINPVEFITFVIPMCFAFYVNQIQVKPQTRCCLDEY